MISIIVDFKDPLQDGPCSLEYKTEQRQGKPHVVRAISNHLTFDTNRRLESTKNSLYWPAH
jgi:hypothetical protein